MLKDQAEFFISSEHLDELDDIVVSESFEYPDFPEGSFSYERVVVRLLEHFDGHQLVRGLVPGLEDDSVGALSDCAQQLVLEHVPQMVGGCSQTQSRAQISHWKSLESALLLEESGEHAETFGSAVPPPPQ